MVDGGLLDAGSFDPSDLRWLTGTHVSAGALALWTPGTSTGRLEIVGVYDPAAVLAQALGDVVTTECFPPESLIAVGAPAEGRVCVVVPVRAVDRDWGLLAVVGEIDTISAREIYQHWAALLRAAGARTGAAHAGPPRRRSAAAAGTRYRAVEENQSEVSHQRIVDLAAGRSDRFEALVR